VGVEAGADAGLHPRSGGDQGLGHGEILGIGEFHQSGVALDQHDPAAVALDHGGVVCGRFVCGPVGPCPAQPVGPESLGGLGAPQVRAVHGVDHRAAVAAF